MVEWILFFFRRLSVVMCRVKLDCVRRHAFRETPYKTMIVKCCFHGCPFITTGFSALYSGVCCVCVCHLDTQTKCTEFYCFQSVLFGLACIHTVIWNCSWPLRKGPSHTVQSIAPNWSWTVWLHHCGETTFTNNSNGSRPTHTHWHKMN